MKGSVIKRGNKWAVVIDVGRDPDGKRIRKWHSGYELKRDAEAARVEILASLQSGSYVAPSKVTLGEWLQLWLDGQLRLAETTKATYEGDAARIAKALGPIRLRDLTTPTIEAFYRELLERLSAKSVRNVHGVLRKALKDAQRSGLVARNAADHAELPKVDRPEPEAWTADEVRAFLGHVADHRLYAAWVLMAASGMRRSELLGLAWRNVDLDAGRLAVVDTLVMVRNRPTLRVAETKTRGSRRVVALDSATVGTLRAHRARQAEEKLAAGELYRDQRLVFANEIGDVVSPDWFTRTTKRLAAAAGVRPLTPHRAGRHTWATLALEQGVHPKVVADRLGHANISTTLDMYSHVTEGMDRDAAETVANLIRGSG
jgi:integrase